MIIWETKRKLKKTGAEKRERRNCTQSCHIFYAEQVCMLKTLRGKCLLVPTDKPNLLCPSNSDFWNVPDRKKRASCGNTRSKGYITLPSAQWWTILPYSVFCGIGMNGRLESILFIDLLIAYKLGFHLISVTSFNLESFYVNSLKRSFCASP